MTFSSRSRSALMILAGALVSLAVFVGCNSSSSTEPAADVTIQLAIVSPVPVPVALHVGETVPLTTEATMSDGSPLIGLAVVHWLSRSPSVITVSPAGIVRASATGQGYVLAEMRTTRGTVQDSVRVVVSPAEPPK